MLTNSNDIESPKKTIINHALCSNFNLLLTINNFTLADCYQMESIFLFLLEIKFRTFNIWWNMMWIFHSLQTKSFQVLNKKFQKIRNVINGISIQHFNPLYLRFNGDNSSTWNRWNHPNNDLPFSMDDKLFAPCLAFWLMMNSNRWADNISDEIDCKAIIINNQLDALHGVKCSNCEKFTNTWFCIAISRIWLRSAHWLNNKIIIKYFSDNKI